MSTSFDLGDEEAGMKVLEDLTKNVKQMQDNILQDILTCNANTEYLRGFLKGRTDKDLFKKNVPVVNYKDVRPHIERVANGEPCDVISSRPITQFLLSSGTSGGVQKMMPCNDKLSANFAFTNDMRMLVTSREVDGAENGKGMMFFFIKPEIKTPCGLPARAATTSYLKSDHFKNRPSNWYYSYTSPDDVILCPDNKQSLYCHLLCGLVQRDEVVRVGSFYASVVVRAIKFLEDFWTELCSNIRLGQISDWITDLDCKKSVYPILGGPRPELADEIEQICSQKSSWEGILTRLWPKTKYIETIITGSMAQYVPTLKFYSNDDMPLVSTVYGSSETIFGINLDPLCKPEDVSYMLMPNMLHYEFKPMDGNLADDEKIVDLADVKLGCSYEPLITTSSGLYRLRVGDVLNVTGFRNDAPLFRFVRRENVVLSVDMEKTNEEELFNAVNKAKPLLESLGLMLIDFASYAETSAIPGHYVLYWELGGKNKEGKPPIDPKVLEECCFAVEESLGDVYKRCRSKDRSAGALEIRVVLNGAFDSLMDFFVSQGASIGQYKTPRCIKCAKALEVMEKRVVARFFSKKCPSYELRL
ncbi:PREDICTED: 4-substituted benzoates-glutamate ligase GH3.12-like [Tarenaya hassleriana]|uniref:4-substituted benzoates-glutamate ligase GH3.12-like n=1 Tax=Tarenaya hassleriana TaxID=28532 RepID=UPI00053C148B|nr:PREDICTED: 4-substituted benzoates-glutamate ligase GH3.12-like [Tarenaya hassleriana]